MKGQFARRALIATLVFWLSWTSAQAGVDMRNSNYFGSWADLPLADMGFPLERVGRTYNSRTRHDGLFGFGWCSDFETRLEFSFEGSITKVHCGAGMKVRFEPEGSDIQVRRRQLIDRIMLGVDEDAHLAAQQARLPIALSEADRGSLRQRLAESAAREEFASRLGLSRPTSAGRYSHLGAVLRHTGEGFELEWEKSFERFDNQGRLIQIVDDQGRTATLHYENERLTRVVSGSGRYLAFEYGATGKFSRIVTDDGLEASYRHSAVGDLVEMKNAWGNTYAFQYDALHNLTDATWPDGTGIKLFYDTTRDWVMGLADHSGCIELYRYSDDPADQKNHYFSRVTKRCKGEVTSRSIYEFKHQTLTDKRTLEEVTSVINGRRTTMRYDVSTGRPGLIDRDGARAAYSYDDQGRLREANGATTRLLLAWDSDLSRTRRITVERGLQRRELAPGRNPRGELTALLEGDTTLVTFSLPEDQQSKEERVDQATCFCNFHTTGSSRQHSEEELVRLTTTGDDSYVLRCRGESRCVLVDPAGKQWKVVWRGADPPSLVSDDRAGARDDDALALALLVWSIDRGWHYYFDSPLGEPQDAAVPGADTPTFVKWRRRFDAAFLARDHEAALDALQGWRRDLPGSAAATHDEWADAAFQLGLQSLQRAENEDTDKEQREKSLEVAREALAGFLDVVEGLQVPALRDQIHQGMHLLAAALYRLKHWNEAIALWERLRSKYLLTEADREHLRWFDVDGRLATAYQMVGRRTEAMALLANKLRMAERADPMSRETAALQVELADLHVEVGDPALAESLYRNAYLAHSLQSQQGDFDALQDMRKLGELLRGQGRQKEADDLYGRALAMAHERFPDRAEDLGFLLVSEANHALLSADYERGLHVMKTLERVTAGLSLSPRLKANIHNSRSIAWSRLGRVQAALEEQTIAVSSAAEGKLDDSENDFWLNLQSNLANSKYDAGLLSEAIALQRSILAQTEAMLPPQHFSRGNRLGHLARFLLADGQYKEGAAAVEQALAILRAWPGTEPWRLLRLLNDYTRGRLRQGKLAEAETLSAQALLLTEQSGNNAVRWRTYALRAEVFAEANDDAAAAFWAKQAIAEIERIRKRLSAVDPALFQDFVSDKSDIYRLLFDVLLRQNRLGEAEEALLLLKRDEQLATRSGKDDGNASLSQRELAWQKRYGEISGRLSRIAAELAHLERKQYADLSKAELKRIDELRVDQEAATQAFRAATDEIDREARAAVQSARDEEQKRAAARLVDIAALGTKNNGALQQVLEKIGSDVVALQYVVLPKKTLVLITTPQLQFHREIFVESEQLTRMIYEFRSRLQDYRDWTFKETARQLNELLIKPVEKDLEQYGARTLMLSLDYKLRYLPFAALHDGKGYLSDRYAIAYFNAASLTALALGDKPSAMRFLGFGMTQERKDLKLKALPNVEAELSGIVTGPPSILPGVRYLDKDFTIEKLRSAVREDYQILHIASHFVLESGDPRNSFLLLGRGELSLNEFQNLNFGRVKWATFSACDTAMGGRGQNGSEMDSLAAASHDRGVKTVLATLWPVADMGVPDFMKSLYARFSPGKLRISKAAALREVQAEFKQGRFGDQFRHPLFWAPYVLLGDWL